jgi:predicted lipid-binding transport protein (Tim44 family)
MSLHLAAAGGGSAGFGGGFHGGGGEGGGGRGFALYLILQLLIRIAIIGHGLGAAVLVGVVLLWLLFARVIPSRRAARSESGPAARRRTARRERRVELAAAEAADEDGAYAPDSVRSEAGALFADIQSAWDGGDRAELRRLVAPGLLAEWERRLDDFASRGWHNRVQLLGPPKVEFVALRHPTVVVRIEAKLRDYVEDQYGNHIKRIGRLGETVRVREYWTLQRRGDRWILQAIEQGGEGTHALEDQVVATPWGDEQALRDEALVEGAVADATPNVADIAPVDFDGDGRARALDLSLADGRFAPDVIEVAARRAVDGWARAVDGDDDALRSVAHPEAINALLFQGDASRRTRVVVRGPKVSEIRIVGLEPTAEPPTLTVDVELRGRRYIEDRATTALVTGSRGREVTFRERWTLALDGDAAQPWRISAVATPLAHA